MKIKVLIQGIKTFKSWIKWLLGRYYLLLHKEMTFRLRNGLSFRFLYPRDSLQAFQQVFIEKVYNKHYEVKIDDYVVDIGASIGDFAVKCADEGAYVYAFESDQVIFDLLIKNRNLRMVIGNYEIKNDKLFANLPKIDLLKMNCFGSEREILRNTTQETFNKIRNIAMEWRGELDGIGDFLLTKGFKKVYTTYRSPKLYWVYGKK